MNDLISRSALIEEINLYEKELMKDREVAIETNDEQMLFAIINQETAICRIRRNALHLPTVYNVDRVVEKLENARNKYQRLCVECEGKEDEAMDIHYNNIIEIVKAGETDAK